MTASNSHRVSGRAASVPARPHPRRGFLPCVLLICALAPGRLRGADRSSPDEEGQALAAELRSQRPAENLTTTGSLRLRDSDGKWGEPVPVRMEVRLGEDYWRTQYQAFDRNQALQETLIVMHTEQRPNRYDYLRVPKTGATTGPAITLEGAAAAIPFAGSEFWLSDLGLEFLHWPQQRVLKHEMRKGRSCRVLESVNANSAPGGYERVWSWIDLEHRGILRAEAYDSNRKLVKEFSIGNFKKVDGRWQLKSMEIRNEKTDARTRLEFDLEIEERAGAAP